MNEENLEQMRDAEQNEVKRLRKDVQELTRENTLLKGMLTDIFGAVDSATSERERGHNVYNWYNSTDNRIKRAMLLDYN